MTFRLFDFFDDPLLNGLREAMGARLVEWYGGKRSIRLIGKEELERLRTVGIDIDGFDQIKVESDGTISFKGQRILVYIRDVSVMDRQHTLPKYHFAFCRTLERMQQNNRWFRYVVANRDDGLFRINFYGSRTGTSEERLNVCQCCLERVSWKGFSINGSSSKDRIQIVGEFKLSDFFSEYPRDLLSVLPKYTTLNAPLNDYSDDWPIIAERLKRERGFRCQSCGLYIGQGGRYFLHGHHKSGEKNDNSPENLEVLCIGCHAEEPLHGHIKRLARYQEFLTAFPHWPTLVGRGAMKT
jgi:hypothetical protein